MPSQGPQLKLSTIGSSLDEVFVGDESSDEQAASRVKIAIGRINLKHMFFKYISGEFVGVGECCWQYRGIRGAALYQTVPSMRFVNGFFLKFICS